MCLFIRRTIDLTQRRQVRSLLKQDYSLYYLDTLKQWKRELEVDVYSYCLLSDHVPLILNPNDEPENPGKLMKCSAGRQRDTLIIKKSATAAYVKDTTNQAQLKQTVIY